MSALQVTPSSQSYLTATHTEESEEKLVQWMKGEGLTKIVILPTFAEDLELPPEAALCGTKNVNSHLNGKRPLN